MRRVCILGIGHVSGGNNEFFFVLIEENLAVESNYSFFTEVTLVESALMRRTFLQSAK